MTLLHNLKDRLLHLNHLRKFVGSSAIAQAMKSGFKQEIMSSPPSGNVLVLSPHPDDDVFGAGGVIKMHTDRKDDVKIIYFTNGTGGVLEDKKKTYEKEREFEAVEALKILGVKKYLFCRYDDGNLKENKTIDKILKSIFNEFKPDIIYAPSFLDTHPDHFETARILKTALKSNNFNGIINSYEVWTPILANRIITIDETIKFKHNAILVHKSQLKNRSYLEAIMGLAKYRAGMFNAGSYAEAFFSTKKELYLELFKLVDYK